MRKWTPIAAAAVALLAASAQGQTTRQPGGWSQGPGMTGKLRGGSMARHRQAMTGRIPAPYDSYRDPLPESGAVVDRGMSIYLDRCESCHGTAGHGDGLAARALSPKPADLAWLSRLTVAQWDPFMYWAIAEGGVRFGTAMPAFKDTLSKEDIWSVVTYIRSELRPPGPAPGA